MRHVALILILTFSSAVFAQELPPPEPAHVTTESARITTDYLRAPPDHNAVQRGKGALLITLGTILLPIGTVMLGTSAIFWQSYRGECYGSCGQNASYLAGGLTLDLLGILVFAGGATMLAVGAQKYVEHKKPAPRFAFTGNGFTF
jgi:hypothetical protein